MGAPPSILRGLSPRSAGRTGLGLHVPVEGCCGAPLELAARHLCRALLVLTLSVPPDPLAQLLEPLVLGRVLDHDCLHLSPRQVAEVADGAGADAALVGRARAEDVVDPYALAGLQEGPEHHPVHLRGRGAVAQDVEGAARAALPHHVLVGEDHHPLRQLDELSERLGADPAEDGNELRLRGEERAGHHRLHEAHNISMVPMQATLERVGANVADGADLLRLHRRVGGPPDTQDDLCAHDRVLLEQRGGTRRGGGRCGAAADRHQIASCITLLDNDGALWVHAGGNQFGHVVHESLAAFVEQRHLQPRFLAPLVQPRNGRPAHVAPLLREQLQASLQDAEVQHLHHRYLHRSRRVQHNVGHLQHVLLAEDRALSHAHLRVVGAAALHDNRALADHVHRLVARTLPHHNLVGEVGRGLQVALQPPQELCGAAAEGVRPGQVAGEGRIGAACVGARVLHSSRRGRRQLLTDRRAATGRPKGCAHQQR
mmetsp:Transcript_65006/g.173840  ORF Transcript_65006/g.173840 Transcript_65006/m.173840 type:complete len:485 (-) Transcript_65006:224-1678(-)